jgi:capsule biosynthesis phosphatase
MEAKDRLRIVIDVDGTLAELKEPEQDYADLKPVEPVLQKLREYAALGYYIIVFSSRNMRTFNNNLGLLQANTLPKLIEWLKKWEVPFDEVHIGKPWCGFSGFYVDDKAIRPSEFVSMSREEIQAIVGEGGA